MSYGFVYIMANGALPDLFKVGFTTGSPFKRAKELSGSTSVPEEFEVVCYAEFTNAAANEARIHQLLADLRVSDRREFFSGPFSRLYAAVMDRSYALALCDHHAAVYQWDEDHPALKSFVGFE